VAPESHDRDAIDGIFNREYEMTIAIGILCRDGVVVGADREVTHSVVTLDERKAHLLKRRNVSLALVGSGTFDLIGKAAEEIDQGLRDDMSEPAVQQVVESVAQTFHDKFQMGSGVHSLDLLIGLKTTPEGGERRVTLLRVANNLVSRRDKFDALGYSSDIAKYLLKNLYGSREPLSVARGVMLATQVLKAVKDSGLYSGGRSDVIQVRLGWIAGFISEDDILLHEASADRFATIMRPVMMAMTDINIDENQLSEIIGRMSAELHAFRSNDFHTRQRRLFATSPTRPRTERVSVTADDLTSVFGVVETSAPGFDHDDEND
jgi:20S proteasome alpha/beta subunit